MIRSSIVLLKRLDSIRKKNGMVFMCRYMKSMSLYIMKYIARDETPLSYNTYNINIKLTRSKLPVILPIYLRRNLRSNREWAIKWILSILNLYRVLPYEGKVNISTITLPSKGFINKELIRFIPLFFKLLPSFTFNWSWEPFLIQAKGSTSTHVFSNMLRKGKIVRGLELGNSTSGFLVSLTTLRLNPQDRKSVV